MSKILTGLVVVFFLMASNAQAHCGKCGVGESSEDEINAMVNKKAEKLTKELSLNDEQKGKVEGIIKDKLEKKHKIMEDKHKAMDALHEDFTAKMNGILTDEQKTKFEAMKDDAGKHCSDCKGGKMCAKCKKMAGHCPDCKDGKMCDKCKKAHKDHKSHDK